MVFVRGWLGVEDVGLTVVDSIEVEAGDNKEK